MNLRSAYCFTCGALAAAVAVASLGGCFSERVAGTDTPPAAELCEGAQPANVVRVQNFAFTPAVLTVSPGTRVTFVNCDSDTHTSTADAGAWDSGLLATRTGFARVFDAAGSFAYHCEPHPFMKGTVVVR